MTWSFVLAAAGVGVLWLTGQKLWWAWAVGVAVQFLWIAFAISTEQYGFIVTAVAYGAVYARNAYRWRGEERAPLSLLCRDRRRSSMPQRAGNGDEVLRFTLISDPDQQFSERAQRLNAAGAAAIPPPAKSVPPPPPPPKQDKWHRAPLSLLCSVCLVPVGPEGCQRHSEALWSARARAELDGLERRSDPGGC